MDRSIPSYQNLQNIRCFTNDSHLGLSNVYIQDLALSWLGADPLVKRDVVLFMGANEPSYLIKI